jgi:hypothetical protein
MTFSNLSKIKPKLRTQGNVTGNFGRPKTKVRSKYSELGVTKVENIHCTTPNEYLNRLIQAYHKTTDMKLRTFISQEIKKIRIQRGQF